MGRGSFTHEDWAQYSSTIKSSNANDIYNTKKAEVGIDVRTIVNPRECFDGNEHPGSIPIIIGLDVTGSMGNVLEAVAKGIGDIVTTTLKVGKIKHPQFCTLGIGDPFCDLYPLQATQFESDIRAASSVRSIYFEQGGGGNSNEGYALPWLWASSRVISDHWMKRRKKGFLITIGDEKPTEDMTGELVSKVLGPGFEHFKSKPSVDSKFCLSMANPYWDVYHVIVREGSWAKGAGPELGNAWRELLGEKAVELQDVGQLCPLVTGLLNAWAGADISKAVDIDPSVAALVRRAVVDPSVSGPKPLVSV